MAGRKLFVSNAPPSVVLIRLVVGGVFLSEGIQNYFFQAKWLPAGLGRLAFLRPNLWVPSSAESKFLRRAHYRGLLTRLAAIPLIADMLVAITSTKIPILLGHGFWRFSLAKLPSDGFWAMAHEARVDFAMLLGSVFLLIVGAGGWSYDAYLNRRK